MRLRLTASDNTPMNAPVNSSGQLLAAETIATASPEPVAWNVKRPAVSTSNQSIAFATPPAIQSSLKPDAAKSGAVTVRSISAAERVVAPQLAADPFTAELKNLAITHVVFPIEIRLDNSLPHLRAAARLDQG
jgi:hypothetical protein